MEIYRFSGTDDVKGVTKTKDEDESSFRIRNRGFPARLSIDYDYAGNNTRGALNSGAGIRRMGIGDDLSFSPERIQYRRKNERLKETPAQKEEDSLSKNVTIPGSKTLRYRWETFLLDLRRNHPIPLTEIMLVFRQLATFQDAGVSLSKALHAIAKGTRQENLRNIIWEVQSHVEAGKTLSRAMNFFPRAFSKKIVSMISLGEATGNLDLMLKNVANILESEINLGRKLQREATYPLMVTAGVPIFVLILAFIIRRSVAPMYENVGIALPFLTRILVFFAGVISNPFFILGVLLLLLFSIFRLRSFLQSEPNALKFDTLLCSLPILGPIFHRIALLRFCNFLALVHETGYPLEKGLLLAGEASGNRLCSESAKKLWNRIRDDGESISEAMSNTSFFPRTVSGMVTAGDETGKLPETLRKAATLMEIDVDTAFTTLTSLLGPVFTAVIGFIIGLIVVAAFYPIAAGIPSVVN